MPLISAPSSSPLTTSSSSGSASFRCNATSVCPNNGGECSCSLALKCGYRVRDPSTGGLMEKTVALTEEEEARLAQHVEELRSRVLNGNDKRMEMRFGGLGEHDCRKVYGSQV